MENGKNNRYGLFASILIALGPIIWLFINISNKDYEKITLNVVFIILTSTIVLFNLKNYLKVYKTRNNVFLEIIKHIVSFIFFILLIATMIILFIAFYLVIAIIQKELFVKGDYMFYLIKSPYSYLLFIIVFIVFSFIVEKISNVKKGLPFFNKFDKFTALLLIPIMYIIFTSVVVVTEDGIYDYSFYNLKGNKYTFADVEYVNTGFNDGWINKGEFFYNIQFKDGKKLKLAHPSSTQLSRKYEYDTWQEYVDIDKYIMDAGAKKESSENGVEHVKMDKVYVDKLLKVVRNK
ncbi:MAG: hypothetical protein MR510_15960 [Clostridium sp.]|uniref:hypothetical protein n=1 Tax=Clostridium sp. TaxID=1506 RepID=UPI002A75B4B1|nr:hypothetical protein [Clostridium sp.]MCI6693937.1 hypothetical protein [Clostridium sp.]MDY2630025.1 hypothetical protein [Clostridium sp.]